MTLRDWLAGHRSLVATATSGTVIAALVATVAIVSSGYTAQRLDLNDGSVWVANGSSQVIGRANTQVLALNTVVASSGADIQTIQRGSTVLLFDRTDSKVDIVDPATSKVQDSVPLPPQDPQLSIAGDNIVIAAGGTGQVWIVPLAQLPTFDAQSPATLSLGANAVTSVTPEGMLFGYSADTRQVYQLDAAHADTVAESTRARFGGARRDVSVTSVGGRWVLFDSVSRTILTADRTIDLSRLISSGANAVLQEASTGGDSVLIASSTGLLKVPLGGGNTVTLTTSNGGIPAAPRVMGGCTFAAWSIGSAWRQCGSSSAVTLTLDSMPASASQLAFVSNADRLVLSDPRGGGVWAVQQAGELIDNWADLITVRKDQQKVEQTNEDTPPDYEKTQVPPVAVDDSFGARPGRTSVLPVLLNDYDANGDVLVISDVTALDESIGHLDLINDSQQVQITLAPSASGTVSFGYSISDGRGGTASATVTVAVRLPSENSPPFQVKQSRALVAAGGRVTQDVLGDWVDPDGDAFYLTSAATAPPDTVTYKPEGTVVFTDGGSGPGLRSVPLVVSDGKLSGTGSLSVTVKAIGSVPIIADSYVKLAYAGQEITLSPLDHVRGGSGTLRLASVPAKSGVTITPSLEAGTFRFLSDQVGTHYIDYVVNDGDQTANGIVRVDVAAPPDANTKPITIPKNIFVQSLSTQTIDVASSDKDPAGGVLLVTGVYNLAPNSGVTAEVLEQRSIRVTLTAPLESGTVTFNYRITNGLAEAEGVVNVVEILRPTRSQPPIANDDSVTVRVGDAIDIPVLDNDVQPDGEQLTLNPLLSTTLGGNSGLLFASGNVLRYLAPQKTGDFTAVYAVSDPNGQSAQAQVKISVREAVQATNNPPVPQTVTARVIAGETVRIPIPLTGIDPDGDSVQLLGQATNPTKGSVTAVGTDYVDFLAGDYSAGTDTFTYSVIDALGARAIGLVRVGISPKFPGARNPVAVSDEVRIRPGGTVSIQPLLNDSDPDGGTLSITKVEPNSKDIVARIEGDIVKVTPPTKPGTYGLVYTIENRFGGTSAAFITVIVSTDAPRSFPVVNDTVLTLSDVLGRDSLDVNVLKNVFFADGNVSTLGVSVLPGYSSDATVTPTKRIQVTVKNKSQIIPFSVANPDDASVVSYAFVWVPGLNDALPQLNRKAPPLTIASESTLSIDLNDYVLAIGGKQVRLTDSTTVQATHSNGSNLVVNDHTLQFTSADKYFGPASISFEVTDGSSATDPTGRKATLVLPIKVTPRQNQPPVFVGGVIDFEPGTSKELDLLKLTNYPYPKALPELTYSVLNPLPDSSFTYTLTGQKIVIRASESAVKGTSTAILLGVKDNTSTGLQGQIELNVVASSRPLARPAPDSVLAPRGQTTTVDVLANDEATNPFPGKPLKVLAIRGLDGGSVPSGLTISPSADNRKLTITASSSAQPVDTNLQYEVADATGDPDRYVWGSITVSVQDKPDPVTALKVTSFGDRVLTVRWSPGVSNNSPITGYDILVTSASGAVSTTSCAVAVCDITTPGNGPANGVRVAVRAINAIGASDATDLGATVWSDIIPPAPTGLAANPLDGGLRIIWNAVTTPSAGSAVNNYRLVVGGATTDVDPSACSGGSCSADVSGLTNGQNVSVSLSARNSALAALATWNSASTTGTPAGKPLSVSSPTATATDSSIALAWGGAFSNNGREITGYRAVAYTGASPTCAAPTPSGSTTQSVGTSTAATFSGLSRESSYSLVVLADNSIGCTASPAVSAHTTPGVVTAISTSGPNKSGATYDYALTGASIGTPLSSDYSFYYRLQGDSVPATEYGPVSFGALLTAEGQQYGHAISVQVRACRNFPDAGAVCQQNWSASFAVGTPVDPRIGPVTFTPVVNPANPNDPSGTFTWPSWTSARYEGIQYSCGNGVGDTLLPGDTSQGGQCVALVQPGQEPVLTIVVIANGGSTYTIQYDRNGNVR
ncbi:Ig-like domain-containing protein [Frigoribacterium sp. UYMn621]|uniref:Ig-like domain-containing protein n=1 Tax=Frigoribacterium sp. UYMn621 TaxID=3156343 RepID=UPI00339500EF